MKLPHLLPFRKRPPILIRHHNPETPSFLMLQLRLVAVAWRLSPYLPLSRVFDYSLSPSALLHRRRCTSCSPEVDPVQAEQHAQIAKIGCWSSRSTSLRLPPTMLLNFVGPRSGL
jgi:hypothetical protein